MPNSPRLPLLRRFVALVLVASGAGSAQAQVPLADSTAAAAQWAADNPTRAQDGKVALYLGREALWLKNNSVIARNDLRFFTGTIEFDLAPMPGSNFAGVVFRRQSEFQEENIYFRPPKSGQFDAVQYAPHVNRQSTWQLYPQFSAALGLPSGQWTHFRLEIEEARLTVYGNGEPEPLFTVPRLRGGFGAGAVGFWARVNGRPDAWAAAVSNISVQPARDTGSAAAAVVKAPPRRTLVDWEVAGPVPTDSAASAQFPLRGWSGITVEEEGLVNLTRALGPRQGRWTAFLRTTLLAERAQEMKVDFAYSDDVEVFLNGKLVYAGANGWQSRYPGYLGLVETGTDLLVLPLRPGRNELRIRLSDDGRFGWGLMARSRAQSLP